MSAYYVLYNPLSGGNHGYEKSNKLKDFNLGKELIFIDITSVDYLNLYDKIKSDDGIIICGGDGTLNRFINDTYEKPFDNETLYYACGSGNDFCRDIGKTPEDIPFKINEYIKNLPSVTVNGKTYHFVDNVGFGIDGYCTEVGDTMRAAGNDKINYAGIAIKGMLGGFRPVNATVTVDGKTDSYKNVWLAPTMKGRFYGGGMMPTPAQNRNSDDCAVSLMIFHQKSKLKTLTVFPSIFNGKHIKHKNTVRIYSGHNIEVVFDTTCPLQIDGETITNVKSYKVSA